MIFRRSEVPLGTRRSIDFPKPSPLKPQTPSSDNNRGKSRDSHRKRKLASVNTSEGENNTLETNNLYYVSYYEPVVENVEVDTHGDLLAGSKTQEEGENSLFWHKIF